jgi:hypothetical protein
MNKNLLLSIISFSISAICWYISMVKCTYYSAVSLTFWYIAIIFTISFTLFISVYIVQKINKDISTHTIITVVDVILGLVTLGKSFWCFATASVSFESILLIYVVPINIIILILNYKTIASNKKKIKKAVSTLY